MIEDSSNSSVCAAETAEGAGSVPAPKLDSGVTADLLRQSLAICGSCRAEVVSSSMSPAVWRGDTVVIEPVSSSTAHIGDLLVVDYGNALVTHRLLRFSQEEILTKGDANKIADDPVGWDKVAGRVSKVVRKSGRVVALQGGLARASAVVVAWLSMSSARLQAVGNRGSIVRLAGAKALRGILRIWLQVERAFRSAAASRP